MRRTLLGATLLVSLLVPAVPAQAAGEQVNIWPGPAGPLRGPGAQRPVSHPPGRERKVRDVARAPFGTISVLRVPFEA